MDDDAAKKTGIPHRFFMTAYTFVNFVQQRAHKGAEKLYGKYNDLMKGYLKSDVVPAILKAKGDARIKVNVLSICNWSIGISKLHACCFYLLLHFVCLMSFTSVKPHMKGIHSPLGKSQNLFRVDSAIL